jgi:hypothetical protein
MAADSEKRKVTIEATETRTTFIPIESRAHITMCQCCLLCDNSRPFINGYPPGPSPWVCDECREAIALVKEFRAGIKEVPADKAKEIEASTALL